MKAIENIFTNRIFTIIFIIILAALTAQAATWRVTKIADTNDGLCDSDCSLREAIAAAGTGDTIAFSSLFDTAQTITLSDAAGFRTLVINKNLTINGKGANLMNIRRDTTSSVNFRIFTVNENFTLVLNGATVSGGRVAGSGVVSAGIAAFFNTNLVINACHITGNSVVSSDVFIGGGISILGGTLNITNSTISNNRIDTANTNLGGGIFINSAVQATISNSTISGNTVNAASGFQTDFNGGGIYNKGILTITNSTVTDNGADGANSAGGIYTETFVSVGNTIIAGNRNNSAQPDVAKSADQNANYNSRGFNLIGNVGAVTTFNQSSDQTGNSSSPTNPLLKPLADNGGTTPTHALLVSSPALDKGFSFGATTDQRGQPRPIDNPSVFPAPGGDNSDIGAFEAGAFASFVVTKIADTNDGACDSDCSLREAIAAAATGDTISFASPLFDTAQTITLSEAAGFRTLVINKNLTINGKGANLLTIRRDTNSPVNFRIFTVNENFTLVLNGATISGGRTAATAAVSGGIAAFFDTNLIINNSHINNNSVVSSGQFLGGGISIFRGTLRITNSTISNNRVETGNVNYGGGIFIGGATQATITNSTISGNTVSAAGGLETDFNGGIYNGGVLTITSSTVTDNGAGGASSAGGIYNEIQTSLGSTIIAANRNNSAMSDIRTAANRTFVSNGFNLIGNAPGGSGITDNVNNDRAGTSSSPLNPRLDALAGYGGTTPTHRLQSNSPVIDKGNGFGAAADQRGATRPVDISTVSNGAGDATDIGAFELQNAASNQPPVANPDSYSTNRNATLTVNAPGVLGNDTDADNGSLTAIKVSDPAHGILSLNANGSFTYTPNAGYSGADSFTYKANDGASDSNVATVTLTVNPGNALSLTVTKIADTNDGVCDADCSLREAIAAAASGDTVQFASPLFDTAQTITLSDAAGFQTLIINKTLIINGKGANLLTVRRDSAAAEFRIFEIIAGFTVNLSGITVSGGVSGSGGGIYNSGTLNLSASVVSGNVGNSFGGGGIYSSNNSTLTVNDSAVVGNFTLNGNGGGIVAIGTVNITNTTISGNYASFGGAIITFPNISTLLLTSCTISNNSAGNSGGGIYEQSGNTTLRNTIVADNTATSNNPDLGGTFNSQGYNLVGNATGATITPMFGDQFGTAAAPIELRLGALQNNGGTTPTRALLAGSPALDTGDSFGLTADQRGFARPVNLGAATYPNASGDAPTGGDAADIGAFEAQTAPSSGTISSFVVNKTADTADGVCDSDCSLREAITAANNNPGADVITFNMAGASKLAGVSPLTIQLTAVLPDLAQSVKIRNTSGSSIVIRGEGAANPYRIFNINALQNVEISNLTITNGSTTATGGGINNDGNLTLVNSTVSDNTSSGFGGGAIYSASSLNITGSTISGNTANGNGNGGGIAGIGTINITNSTISGNSGAYGGGIITFTNAVMRITSSTISNNSSQNFGGGVLEQAGGATIRNAIIADNTAGTTSPDVNGTFNSEGYNLIENVSGATINETQNAGTNITGQDPMLGTLQNNGGTTRTQALLPGSPAIEKGKSFGAAIDQRGFTRPADNMAISNAAGGDGSDIGAFEVQLAPTAASVSIGGRVLTHSGSGLQNARVILTDASGNTRGVITSSFGYYHFDDVEVGTTYIISVVSKRYQFAPQVVSVSDETGNLNLTALP